mgnify:FL=1
MADQEPDGNTRLAADRTRPAYERTLMAAVIAALGVVAPLAATLRT